VVALAAGGAGATTRAGVGTIGVVVNGSGTVTLSPPGTSFGRAVGACPVIAGVNQCSVEYPAGTRVTLAATPAQGSQFVGWSTFDCKGRGTCTIRAAAGRQSVVATFSPLGLHVQVGAGEGLVTSAPPGISCPPTCRGLFTAGSEVKLLATSADAIKWHFGCTRVAPEGPGLACFVRVVEETEVGVSFGSGFPTFVLPDFSVDFRVRLAGRGRGRVTGPQIDCPSRCAAEIGFGTPIKLRARAGPSSRFRRWRGACSTQPTCPLQVGPITSIQAVFDRVKRRPG
jgi:hypothetical protein